MKNTYLSGSKPLLYLEMVQRGKCLAFLLLLHFGFLFFLSPSPLKNETLANFTAQVHSASCRCKPGWHWSLSSLFRDVPGELWKSQWTDLQFPWQAAQAPSLQRIVFLWQVSFSLLLLPLGTSFFLSSPLYVELLSDPALAFLLLFLLKNASFLTLSWVTSAAAP